MLSGINKGMQTTTQKLNQELALATVACLRRQELGARSREAMRDSARRGVYVGKPVNGYVKNFGCQTHQVDETKRERIVHIWHLAGVEGWTLRRMLEECHRIGLASVSSGRMSLNSLHLMLTNPFYTGKIRTAAGLADGKHEALVSWTMFETVQRNLRKRKC